MIDSMYQAEIDRNLDRVVARPPNEPGPRPGAFSGFWRAGGGAPAGVLDAAAARADETYGFGQVLAAGGTESGAGMFATQSDAERAQAAAAHAKLMSQGVDMNSPQGDALRARARDFMPDPQSTGAATQVAGGLLNFGVQAVGAGVSGPGGLVNLGVDQALTESDRLRLQGVDEATRTKAGATAGVFAAGSMLLPMSGATRAIRAVKGAAGGVAATAGQAESEKLILEHAGYDNLASQYDPLDPVALALGALVPAGFGAAFGHAPAPRTPLVDIVRNLESKGRRYDADGKLLTSRTGAEGEMQVEPGTQTDPGFGVAPAKDHSPEEIARVGRDYLAAMEQRYPGEPDKALAAYNAGPGALDAAVKAHGADWLAHMPEETQHYVALGSRELAGHAAATDPNVVAAARVNLAAEAIDRSRLTPDDDLAGYDQHAAAVETAADQIARGEDVNVAEAVNVLEEPPLQDGMVRLYHGGLDMPDVNSRFVAPGDRAYAEGYARKSGDDGRVFYADVPDSDPRLMKAFDDEGTAQRAPYTHFALTGEEAAAMRALPAVARRLDAVAHAVDELRAARAPAEPASARGAGRQAFDAARAAADSSAPRQEAAPGAGKTQQVEGGIRGHESHKGEPAPSPEPSHLEAAVEQALRDHPDLAVTVDGMEKATTAAELLDAVRADAAEMGVEGKLHEIAVQCAIRN